MAVRGGIPVGSGGFTIVTTADTRGLDGLYRQYSQLKFGTPPRPIQIALKAWGRIYRNYLQQRFKRNSRGGGGRGGQWKGHAPSTIKRRGRGAPILYETGTLQKELGTHVEPITTSRGIGVRIGYPPNTSHPTAKMTVARLAAIHQRGAPSRNLPARPIVVFPPQRVLKEMSAKMRDALRQLIRKHNLG